MNIALGDLAAFVRDLRAIQNWPGFCEASSRLIDAMVDEAERNRARRGARSSGGSAGSSGGQAICFTVTVQPR